LVSGTSGATAKLMDGGMLIVRFRSTICRSDGY
jgi:hypothetical protein